MFKQTFAQKLTALVATAVFSATCLTAAVGPATQAGGKAPAAMAGRIVA